MSQDDLEGDPEAEALKPKVSKQALIAAVVVGALFALALTAAGYVFEQRLPRIGPPPPPDAGPVEVPDIVGLDAGQAGPPPWLEGEPAP